MAKTSLARAVGLALLCLALSGCVQMAIDEGTAFQPPARTYASPATTADDLAERWAISVGPGALNGLGDVAITHGFWTQGETRIAWTAFTRGDGPRPLVLNCGGNGGDRYNSAVSYARKALPWANVLTFDYPGYGDSTGEPSEPAFEAALPLVMAGARQQAGGQPLVLWGQSLGGFICARLATQLRESRALILETTARNAESVAEVWTPWFAKPFVRVRVAPSLASYDTAADAAAYGGPVLVLGAGRDETLDVSLARALHVELQARGTPVTYVEFPQATHMTTPDAPGFHDVIDAFLTPKIKS